jgi:outer membrane protein insertion porin family
MPKSLRLVHCLLLCVFSSISVMAQQPDTSKPTSVDPDLVAIPQSKSPKEYVLAGIVFTGTKAYDQSLLTSISGLNIGDKIVYPGGDNFSHAIQNLWKQNLFANIQIFFTKIDGKDIYIEIHVVERPRLGAFAFKGVKKGQEDDLKSKSGLVKGRVVTENTKLSAIQNIQRYFTEKGYQSAEVKIDERIEPNAANTVNLTLYITKGNKVRISQIDIFGNENVTEGKLKSQLKDTKEAMRLSIHRTEDSSVYGVHKYPTLQEYIKDWGFLSPSKTINFIDPYFRFRFSSAKFDQKKFDGDKEKLIAYYNSIGYRDAVIEADTQYYNRKGNLDVNIKISEGHKYYFGNISWKGNTKYPDSILSLILGIKKGDIYNLETLNKRVGKSVTPEGGDILSLYEDDGYLFFHADPIETAVYNDTIDHEIRIVEGPQATIKNVTISGNEKTKEYVIRRELRTIPGDKFSRTEVIRTNREIAQLGYFNQEKINPGIVPNQDDGTVDINWTVEEKSSDQLELSAGWGGGIGLTGTLGVTFNNFSIRNIFKKSSWDPLPTGDGQKLSVRVQSNGRAFRSYNGSFTEPWFGGKKRNSLTFSAASTKYSNSYNYATGTYSKAAGDTSYLKSLSFSIALGKQLKWPDDYFTLVYQLNYTQYNLRNYPGFFRLSDGTNLSNGKSNNFSLKISLSRNSVDAPLFPRQGSSFVLSGQFTPPYSLFDKTIATSANPYKFVEFHKWRFNGEWYVPLTKGVGEDKNKQFILKLAAKYGFMGRYTANLDYSPFERFQLGDAGLSNNYGILGYDIISQRGYPIYTSSDPKVNPDQNSTSVFFTLFNKYTAELRYPFSTNPSSTIYGLAFFEAANGWYTYKDYNPFKLRRSVGLGMRFFLPMFGLLGFDYGVGLDRLGPGVGLKGAAKFTFLLGFEPE